MTFREAIHTMILSVTYDKSHYSSGPNKWEIIIETHPDYADDSYDAPISMCIEGDNKIELETEEAEALGQALLRAVQIRRNAIKAAGRV